ncbi:MAG TPA: hypothetical protein VKY92_14225 [Verrucomicrobiae bacterium]|nr:hypothetical protein [Verrucomicrobiae bacterium]
MSIASNQRSEDFLRVSDQFKLGGLTTESSHPVTATLSDAACADTSEGLRLLFEVDQDVLRTYRAFVDSRRAIGIFHAVLSALNRGGRLFFTGCGSTGRLSIQLVSIWREFWQQQRSRGIINAAQWENRAFSAMAGGDYALIKSVEGFEDFTDFGKRQLADLDVSAGDVVFAITEGGETSFVIGTAWKGVDAGAKVYFVYNNPDETLRATVQRSREVIEDPRIEKINLTTGPMAITGSTRMQATTIQLCVLVTILEMVVSELLRQTDTSFASSDPLKVPEAFLSRLEQLASTLRSAKIRTQLARLVELEETAYRAGHKNNYYADRFAIDVLTDTTERSPTYCTPPFRKFDDRTATESWAFLFTPAPHTPEAWRRVLRREPACVEWDRATLQALVGEQRLAATSETVRKISRSELMRFRIGLDGIGARDVASGDISVAVVSERERLELTQPGGFFRAQLESAQHRGARVGLIYFGSEESLAEIEGFLRNWELRPATVLVPVPTTEFLLDGIARVGVKALLNALSTCTMVRLGRVMGNYMIWVVPSNLKLVDRATRYIAQLANLTYQAANQLLFEVIEYVEPRMKTDQSYPPVVAMAVVRARDNLSNEQAEAWLAKSVSVGAPP